MKLSWWPYLSSFIYKCIENCEWNLVLIQQLILSIEAVTVCIETVDEALIWNSDWTMLQERNFRFQCNTYRWNRLKLLYEAADEACLLNIMYLSFGTVNLTYETSTETCFWMNLLFETISDASKPRHWSEAPFADEAARFMIKKVYRTQQGEDSEV